VVKYNTDNKPFYQYFGFPPKEVWTWKETAYILYEYLFKCSRIHLFTAFQRQLCQKNVTLTMLYVIAQ